LATQTTQVSVVRRSSIKSQHRSHAIMRAWAINSLSRSIGHSCARGGEEAYKGKCHVCSDMCLFLCPVSMFSMSVPVVMRLWRTRGGSPWWARESLSAPHRLCSIPWLRYAPQCEPSCHFRALIAGLDPVRTQQLPRPRWAASLAMAPRSRTRCLLCSVWSHCLTHPVGCCRLSECTLAS
jgi:hypothetical protein